MRQIGSAPWPTESVMSGTVPYPPKTQSFRRSFTLQHPERGPYDSRRKTKDSI